MKKKECFLFAKITKTHGIKGNLILLLEEERNWDDIDINLIFIEIESFLVPFFVKKNSFLLKNNSKAILKIEDINSEKEAKELINNSVFLRKEDFEFFEETDFDTRINFLIIDENFGVLGNIQNIFEYSKNKIFQVIKNDKEILIPANDVFFKKIDKKNKIIYTSLPEGLIELNN